MNNMLGSSWIDNIQMTVLLGCMTCPLHDCLSGRWVKVNAVGESNLKQQDVRFILKVSPWYFRCFCHIIPASHRAIFFTYVFFVFFFFCFFVFFVSLKLWKGQKCKAMTNSPNVTERKQTSGTAGKWPDLVPTMLPFLQIINLQEGHARTMMWPNSAWKRSWFVSSLTCRSCDIGKSKHYCRNILELLTNEELT